MADIKKQTAGELNFRRELFAKEFIVDLNGKEAAIRAGYSVRSAKQISSKLLTNVDLRSRVSELMDERSKRTLVDADFVVRNLIDIAMKCQAKVPVLIFDPTKKCMVQKQDDEERDVWEFDSSGANKALELLGKHLAMFTEKNRNTIDFIEQPLFGPAR